MIILRVKNAIELINKQNILVLGLSVLTYIVFLYPLLNPNVFFASSDVKQKHLPARVYFHKMVTQEHRFPFWTEKQYSGFPIYADPENGYLHPINTIFILVFGPVLSYKIMHFLYYAIGSISLYFLLKRYGMGLITYFIANLVFYFSFFSLNHNIHFNILTITFLFPLNILLTDLFIRKKQLKYLVIQSLVLSLGLLWGQAQFIFLVFLGIVFYLVILGYKNISIKQFIAYVLCIPAIVFFLTLFQTIPTYDLYRTSRRSGTNVYRNGTLTPALLSMFFFPFLFGRKAVNYAETFKQSISYTESYIYTSVVAFILAWANLMFSKLDKLKIYLYSLLVIFVVLSCIGYVPIDDDWLPVITMFRYWTRSVFLAVFAIGILAGQFIEKHYKDFRFRNLRKSWLLPIALIVYLITAYFTNINSYDPDFQSSFPWNRLLIEDTKIWLILVGTVFVTTGVMIISHRLKKPLIVTPFGYKFSLLAQIVNGARILLVTLVLFDLLYYSQDIIHFRIKTTPSDYIEADNLGYEKERIVVIGSKTYGLRFLYHSSWSPFGYSQFAQENYIKLMKDNGLRYSNYGDGHPYIHNLNNFAITRVINTHTDVIQNINGRELELISNDVEGEYITKKEGYIKMKIQSKLKTNLDTYIKSDKYWLVNVNNARVEPDISGVFMKIPVEKGENIVEIKYVPKLFYLGLFLSGIFAVVLSVIVAFVYIKNVNHQEINRNIKKGI